jgi:hypothetical protein
MMRIKNSKLKIQKSFAGKLWDEVVGIEDTSQVEEKSVVIYPADDRGIGGAELLRDGVGTELWVRDADDDCRQLFGGQGAATDLCR